MAAFPGSDCAAWPRGSAGVGAEPGGLCRVRCGLWRQGLGMGLGWRRTRGGLWEEQFWGERTKTVSVQNQSEIQKEVFLIKGPVPSPWLSNNCSPVKTSECLGSFLSYQVDFKHFLLGQGLILFKDLFGVDHFLNLYWICYSTTSVLCYLVFWPRGM